MKQKTPRFDYILAQTKKQLLEGFGDVTDKSVIQNGNKDKLDMLRKISGFKSGSPTTQSNAVPTNQGMPTNASTGNQTAGTPDSNIDPTPSTGEDVVDPDHQALVDHWVKNDPTLDPKTAHEFIKKYLASS